MKKNIIIITIMAIITCSLSLKAEDNNSILSQQIKTIKKEEIKKSKARNIAEVIKEYSNIDIKNKKTYTQSTFIVNGRILDNNQKKIYLFFQDKNKTKSIEIKYNIYTGNIVYNIEMEEYQDAEERLYVKLGKDAYTDTITTIKYKKEETNANKKKSKIDVLKYNISDENVSLNFKVNTSGEERSFSGRKSKDADVRSFINNDLDFKINPIKEIGFTGRYFVDIETDIALLNRENTNKIKKQNLYQGGNFGISLKPVDFMVIETLYFISSKEDLMNNTNKIHTTQGSKTSISFNIPIKEINSTIKLKGNYSYLVGENLYNVSLNNNSLPGLPKHQFNTSLEYIYKQNNNFESSVLINVQYIGDEYNKETKSANDKAYTTFDIVSSLTFNKHTVLKLGINNILDVKYETIQGYPISSREYFISVTAKL